MTKAARLAWFVLGWISVGFGGVGIILPGLPSTAFFIAAAYCFSKSSPRFEQWVLNLPKIGPMVRDYRSGLGMPRRTKHIAITSMWLAIILSSIVLSDRWYLVVTVVALGAIGTWYIRCRVPTNESPGTQ